MDWEICILFFFIAMMYSSVGFGGGSSYLAILALYGTGYLVTRSTSLLCNIIVVASGTYILHKNNHLDWKKSLPLTLASVPMAFVGGFLPIEERSFYLLLGSTLLLAALLTWFQPKPKTELDKGYGKNRALFNSGIGGGIGFLSGMVGIGGGIFLAPVLYITRWGGPKAIAATSSLFILVNSIAGLAGQVAKPDFTVDWRFSLKLMLCVFLGGQLGTRIGAVKLPAVWVRRATAVLILYVGIGLLQKYI